MLALYCSILLQLYGYHLSFKLNLQLLSQLIFEALQKIIQCVLLIQPKPLPLFHYLLGKHLQLLFLLFNVFFDLVG
jgi:hypothetical protein